MKGKYFKKFDYIRVLCCFAVLLYHIGVLKGGYLAVCTFFVLSGYLSVLSGFKKEKFSYKEYYLSRLKKIYFPLLVVTFTSIFFVLKIPNINWMNLKPETNSILFGYNNFWQLSANMDYFVKHVSSPFMHLWYISILIQFEIVFPFIFNVLRNLGKKLFKFVPCIILLVFGILSYLFFKLSLGDNIMFAYYNTFTRIFSLLFGMLLGFVHMYYGSFVLKGRGFKSIMFWFYMIIMILSFCFIDSKSFLFSHGMILITLVSMRLIDYGLRDNGELYVYDKKISSLSKVSYEVYLIQYPVIFMFQNININDFIRVILIIIITFILSYIINGVLNIHKKDKLKMLKFVSLILVSLLTLAGAYEYVCAKDYSEDMKKLESDLNKNRLVLRQKQKEYWAKEKNEKDEWEATLNDLNKSEEEIKEMVKNLKIVGVGDSIMELTINNLFDQFPNGYFDATVSRTEKQGMEVLKELKSKGILGDVVLLSIGTNGNCTLKCKEELMGVLENRKVFWVNATNPDYDTFNPTLNELASKYENVHIIDWVGVSKNHPEYIVKDGVHPSVSGCKVYAQTIFNSIYQQYLDEFKEQKQIKVQEHEDQEKSKITFIGNELLLGVYDNLSRRYNDSVFSADKDFNYKSLINTLNKNIKNNTLSHNVVLIFDSSINISDKEYRELVKMCRNYNLYVVDMDGSVPSIKGINIVNFYEVIKKNKGYVQFDNVHLTDKGAFALTDLISSYLK